MVAAIGCDPMPTSSFKRDAKEAMRATCVGILLFTKSLVLNAITQFLAFGTITAVGIYFLCCAITRNDLESKVNAFVLYTGISWLWMLIWVLFAVADQPLASENLTKIEKVFKETFELACTIGTISIQ